MSARGLATDPGHPTVGHHRPQLSTMLSGIDPAGAPHAPHLSSSADPPKKHPAGPPGVEAPGHGGDSDGPPDLGGAVAEHGEERAVRLPDGAGRRSVPARCFDGGCQPPPPACVVPPFSPCASIDEMPKSKKASFQLNALRLQFGHILGKQEQRCSKAVTRPGSDGRRASVRRPRSTSCCRRWKLLATVEARAAIMGEPAKGRARR